MPVGPNEKEHRAASQPIHVFCDRIPSLPVSFCRSAVPTTALCFPEPEIQKVMLDSSLEADPDPEFLKEAFAE